MSITPYENLRMLVNGQSPQWIPFTLDLGTMKGFTEPMLHIFQKKTGHEDPAEYFDYDTRSFSLKGTFGGADPGRWHGKLEPGTYFDEWGVGHWAGGLEATYEKMYPPLKNAQTVKDIEDFPSPVVNTSIDTSLLKDYKKRGYPTFGYAGSMYEWSWWLRGMEQFLMDTLLAPEIVEALVEKVKNYTKSLALESARLGIDVLCFFDDTGMQTQLQIRPDIWRKFIKPAWKEVIDAVRRQKPDVILFFHSCGNITEIVPDIIELGINILHPIQPECMDAAAFKKKFGSNIVMCASLSSQRLIPFGTSAEIKAEVRRLKKVCGYDKQCILSPSNMLQPETPWENIVAFAQEAKVDR